MDIEINRTAPQAQFMASDAKFRAFVSGVGAGKTACGWMCVLEYAFKNPGSLGVVVAPTYPLIRDVILKERPNWIPDALIKSYNKTNKEMVFVNGSSLIFRSAKDDSQIELLRGLSIAYAWIDEATILPRLALEVLTARLRQPGFEPKMWITCTPRKGWVFDLLKTNPPPEWFCLDNIPTQSNTFLDKGYVKSLKDLYTGQFYDQEVMGQWIDFSGLVWNVAVSNIIPSKPLQTVYGIDIGFTHPSSIIVIQKEGDRYYVVDEFYQSHTNDSDLIKALSRLVSIYGQGTAYVDPSVPRVITGLNRAGYKARPANNKIMDGLRTVRALFDTGHLFVHPKCENFIRESETYVWANKDKEAPININDDACDAARYGIMGITAKTIHSRAGVIRGT